MKKLLLIILTVFLGLTVSAQTEKCGTMKNLAEQKLKDPTLEQRMGEIETFTAEWIKNRSTQKAQAIITIPVVVHVIHNGEAVGTGANISNAQIVSQITVLNEDFRLKNADSLQPSHPFWSATADCQIEFCLASQDEFGSPTTGIERINGGQPDWAPTDIDDNLKPATIWDRNLYLNLWTVKYDAANSTLLGYAQFPGGADSTDGVVCRYDAFGYTGNVTPPNDLGRTETHEVGHWLNLYHIWGDNQPNCGNDSVSDTEPADHEHYGCPSFPHDPNNACGTGADGVMYMNYMDYVDDYCMVMFTYGQGVRMQAALNGARSSLLASTGCQTVGINENNLTDSFADRQSFKERNSHGGQLFRADSKTNKKYFGTDSCSLA